MFWLKNACKQTIQMIDSHAPNHVKTVTMLSNNNVYLIWTWTSQVSISDSSSCSAFHGVLINAGLEIKVDLSEKAFG